VNDRGAEMASGNKIDDRRLGSSSVTEAE